MAELAIAKFSSTKFPLLARLGFNLLSVREIVTCSVMGILVGAGLGGIAGWMSGAAGDEWGKMLFKAGGAGLVVGGVVVVGSLVLLGTSKKKAKTVEVEEQELARQEAMRKWCAEQRPKREQEWELKRADPNWQKEGRTLAEQAKIGEDWGEPFQEQKEKIKEYVTNTDRTAKELDAFFKGNVTAAMNKVDNFEKGTEKWENAVNDTEKLIKAAQKKAEDVQRHAIIGKRAVDDLLLVTKDTENVNHLRQWANWQWEELLSMQWRTAFNKIREGEDWLSRHERKSNRSYKSLFGF